MSKELEEREMALLERLQRTYQTEKAMVERLYKVNAESPVKPPPQGAMYKTTGPGGFLAMNSVSSGSKFVNP